MTHDPFALLLASALAWLVVAGLVMAYQGFTIPEPDIGDTVIAWLWPAVVVALVAGWLVCCAITWAAVISERAHALGARFRRVG